MKKLWLRLVVLVLPFFALNLLYICANYEKGDFSEIVKFRTMPDGIELANTGSSHGWDFSYAGFPGYVTFNAAMRAQPPYYDFTIFRQFARHFAPGAVLLIEFSYNNADALISDATLESIEGRYYQFLDYKNLYKPTPFKYIKHRLLPIAAAQKPFKTIRQFLFERDRPTLSEFATTAEGSFASVSEKEQERLFWHTRYDNGWDAMFPHRGDEGTAYNRALLRDFIALCRAHGVTPVIVTTPITDGVNALYEETGFFSIFDRLKADVCAENGVVWLDYSRDARFSARYDLFGDTNHLNKHGAAQFTAAVVTELRARGLLKQRGV